MKLLHLMTGDLDTIKAQCDSKEQDFLL